MGYCSVTMQIRLLILALIFSTGPIAQVKNLPPIIERLASFNKAVTCFSLYTDHFIETPDLPESFRISGRSFIKTKSDLFLEIDGTGRIYRLNKKNPNYEWTRIDSTYFTGYNFGAINFCLDTTFYSFGGNGFWITNGILRFFNPISKEWNHIKF
jgi:N-acetylneuraminic acid mutarotase